MPVAVLVTEALFPFSKSEVLPEGFFDDPKLDAKVNKNITET